VVIPDNPPQHRKGKFYLMITRIEPNKHLELAVMAANRLRVPLKIVGVSNTPWYDRYLRSLAGPTVEFLGFRSDAEIARLYRQSIAFIFPTKHEDFGIAPLEATAHGVPVISYYGGGAKETVVEGVTGTFFQTHTADALVRAMIRLRTMHFNLNKMYAHAKQFSEARFKREFMDYVTQVIREEGSR
jgi:glycosyltransferase involved in cell wall biosynthesis